jgi:hypothetical protein
MTTKISNDNLLELLTLTAITDEFGTVRYFNSNGLLHRIHGPACIFKGGFADWFEDGKHIKSDYYANSLTCNYTK